jgi:hypothetical protein
MYWQAQRAEQSGIRCVLSGIRFSCWSNFLRADVLFVLYASLQEPALYACYIFVVCCSVVICQINE